METRNNKLKEAAASPVVDFLWTFLMGFSNSLPVECFMSGERIRGEEKTLPSGTIG